MKVGGLRFCQRGCEEATLFLPGSIQGQSNKDPVLELLLGMNEEAKVLHSPSVLRHSCLLGWGKMVMTHSFRETRVL